MITNKEAAAFNRWADLLDGPVSGPKALLGYPDHALAQARSSLVGARGGNTQC